MYFQAPEGYLHFTPNLATVQSHQTLPHQI